MILNIRICVLNKQVKNVNTVFGSIQPLKGWTFYKHIGKLADTIKMFMEERGTLLRITRDLTSSCMIELQLRPGLNSALNYYFHKALQQEITQEQHQRVRVCVCLCNEY